MKTLDIINKYLIKNKNKIGKNAHDIKKHFDNIHDLIKDHDLSVEDNLTEKNIKLYKDIKECSKSNKTEYFKKYKYSGFIDKFDEINIHEIFSKILIYFYKIDKLEDTTLDCMDTYIYLVNHHNYFRANKPVYKFYRIILWHKFQFLENPSVWHQTLRFSYELFDRLYDLDDVDDILMINADTIFCHNSDGKNEYLNKATEYLDGLFTFDYYKTYSGFIDSIDKYALFEYNKDTVLAVKGYDTDTYNPNKHIFNKIYRKYYNDMDYEDFNDKKLKDDEIMSRYHQFVREKKLKRILR